MATWKLVSRKLGNDDNLTVSIQEVTGQITDAITGERVDVGKIYSVKFHKTYLKAVFLDALKEQIKADRAKTLEANALLGDVDLSNFETFINS